MNDSHYNKHFFWKVIEMIVIPEYKLFNSELFSFLNNRYELMKTIYFSQTCANNQIQFCDKKQFIWIYDSTDKIVQYQTTFCTDCGNYLVCTFNSFNCGKINKIRCLCTNTRMCQLFAHAVYRELIVSINYRNCFDFSRLIYFQNYKHQKLQESIKIYTANKQAGISNKKLLDFLYGKCNICYDWCFLSLTICRHKFCSECIIQWKLKNNTCPLCRTIL